MSSEFPAQFSLTLDFKLKFENATGFHILINFNAFIFVNLLFKILSISKLTKWLPFIGFWVSLLPRICACCSHRHWCAVNSCWSEYDMIWYDIDNWISCCCSITCRFSSQIHEAGKAKENVHFLKMVRYGMQPRLCNWLTILYLLATGTAKRAASENT